MSRRQAMKVSILDLEAPPPDLRDLTPACQPRQGKSTDGAGPRPMPGLAPESALRLHPCRALSSAPASTSVGEQQPYAKLVVVADREE